MIQSIKAMKSDSAGTKERVRMGLGLIFGLAADAAITAAFGGLMPAGKGWKRILRMGGVFILGMMTGEKVEEYVCKVFDETDQALKEAKKEQEESGEEIQAEGAVK